MFYYNYAQFYLIEIILFKLCILFTDSIQYINLAHAVANPDLKET